MTFTICIHGHFYQPPRENPWTGEVEVEESAAPFHDWNERITYECYRPNLAARILDSEGDLKQTLNNYSRISFNFGPTLLTWMEKKAPDVYQGILAADRESRKNFSGHGSAIAQAYNHMILPLANRRDKETQVIWGIRDFEYRFGRKPEGMWLPETAVDRESLEIMADQGIQFTILAPHQARHAIDPTLAYDMTFASGKKIHLFFYNGPLSRAVAFERLLDNGGIFAHALLNAFPKDTGEPRMVHIATDGETYGHHHKFGEMALAFALEFIRLQAGVRLVNYGEFLEKNPLRHPVEIIENTSWSCEHGVERWRSDCGCHSGSHPQWKQAWRKPLREAFDWLRDQCIPLYERETGRFLRDPWSARNDYIDILLDTSSERLENFFDSHAKVGVGDAEKKSILKLLELQRNAMLMYTSCGWFFDDLSRIETLQVLKYAARTLQLARELFREPLESGFLERLEKAESNRTEYGNGRRIFKERLYSAIAQPPVFVSSIS